MCAGYEYWCNTVPQTTKCVKKSLKIPVIRIRISKKNRQHNGLKKKYNRTNNDLQHNGLKKKYNRTNNDLQHKQCELGCSGRNYFPEHSTNEHRKCLFWICEHTKVVMRSHKSKKYIQYNSPLNNRHKTAEGAIRTSLTHQRWTPVLRKG
jgi:hypothetical protein